ncbi:MAG: EAL domain-containing protein [Burkholderiales bacterium]|nr:EAL domain-containing protein [Burkholderiales bacterium]
MSTRSLGHGGLANERPGVLMVDDDEINLMLTRAALQADFDIVEAQGGEEALRLLRGWTPDLILLDARMPGIDGFETCQEIRAMYGFENVPVLMLTGLDDDASIQRAFQVGATDFFVKSNQWSLLVQRLHYMLRAARTNRELARNKANLARAQDLARMGSFDWYYNPNEPVGKGLELSEQALRVFGHGPDDRLGMRDILHMLSLQDRHDMFRSLRLLLRNVSVIANDVPMQFEDGRERVIHVEAEPEFAEHGQCIGYKGIVQDVTDRRHAEDSIRRLASTDALTTLPNRRQLMIRAERALEFARERGYSVALLMIDLDRFKNINDTLGHYAGDELLIEVSQRLRMCVRHSDQFSDGLIESAGARTHRALEAVARLGGDEFVALLPEVHADADAQRVAERILTVLREPVYVAGQECFATASVGIAIFPRDGDNVADLLRNADVAMYAAKNAGRNASITYSPRLAGRGPEVLVLETALHKALERNELELHYQPKVDVTRSCMVGVEALMRWRRNGQLVAAGEFIPLAEETGLIVPMTEWALREAARQAREWQGEFGFDDTIAVNMPSRMFHRSDLIDQIHEAVGPHGVPPRRLLLEITEGTLMTNLEQILPTLHHLNELGVQISVDDFGTGYSSLAYLTTLPISEVKIDRSFVNKLGVTPKSTAVITTIVALARALGLRVIAEGVETISQQNILHRQGCSSMQGFLFARPMPGHAIPAWAKNFSQSAPRVEAIGFDEDDDLPRLALS